MPEEDCVTGHNFGGRRCRGRVKRHGEGWVRRRI